MRIASGRWPRLVLAGFWAVALAAGAGCSAEKPPPKTDDGAQKEAEKQRQIHDQETKGKPKIG